MTDYQTPATTQEVQSAEMFILACVSAVGSAITATVTPPDLILSVLFWTFSFMAWTMHRALVVDGISRHLYSYVVNTEGLE